MFIATYQNPQLNQRPLLSSTDIPPLAKRAVFAFFHPKTDFIIIVVILRTGSRRPHVELYRKRHDG
jgi:hypothetical protein